jgi:hypothetical protein
MGNKLQNGLKVIYFPTFFPIFECWRSSAIMAVVLWCWLFPFVLPIGFILFGLFAVPVFECGGRWVFEDEELGDDLLADLIMNGNSLPRAEMVKLDEVEGLGDNEVRLYDFDFTEANACLICLESLEEDIAVLGCGHILHNTCHQKWQETNRSCAFCRTSVKQMRVFESVAELQNVVKKIKQEQVSANGDSNEENNDGNEGNEGDDVPLL